MGTASRLPAFCSVSAVDAVVVPTLAKLDVDQNPTVTQTYKIQAMPTMMIFKDGKKVAERVGALTQKKQLQDWINGSI